MFEKLGSGKIVLSCLLVMHTSVTVVRDSHTQGSDLSTNVRVFEITACLPYSMHAIDKMLQYIFTLLLR